MLHDVYSSFDAAVCAAGGLFKMDTIGDAYIVIGWLPLLQNATAATYGWSRSMSGASGSGKMLTAAAREDSADVCCRLLYVARAMLAALASYRGATGRAVHGRLGLGCGSALAGALGRLQPRYHVVGEGPCTAELLEHEGVPDALHVSVDVLRVLSVASSPSGLFPSKQLGSLSAAQQSAARCASQPNAVAACNGDVTIVSAPAPALAQQQSRRALQWHVPDGWRVVEARRHGSDGKAAVVLELEDAESVVLVPDEIGFGQSPPRAEMPSHAQLPPC
jgi:class 3 adenylate cyclase